MYSIDRDEKEDEVSSFLPLNTLGWKRGILGGSVVMQSKQ